MDDDVSPGPIILPLRNGITTADIEAACHGDCTVYACDFYLQGAERWRLEAGGLRLGRILNVDHHAPIPFMEAPITSTVLAYAHLTESDGADTADRGPCVAINHTDCDSVLSSAMLMGYLPADPALVRASICADHTGEADPVAELLQALDEGRQGDRNAAQYHESLRNLHAMRSGSSLEPMAMTAIARRRERQAKARQMVDAGGFSRSGAVALGISSREIDGAFFPALLPEATVIMVASPHPEVPARWTVKLRLGRAAPRGLTLHRLRVTDWDSNFGGRWNAGSNKRGGGTTLSPDRYAAALAKRIDAVVDESNDAKG